jgi:transcriptional regulator with XRE-family HTH domain
MGSVEADRRRARRQTLAEFLRSRRARVDPGTIGVGRSARRRVPGLRREEVAQLANVGVSWYTWLEQGRDVHPSPPVLAAVADALQLDEHERRYLFALAETEDPDAPGRATGVDLQAMVDGYGAAPAYVVTTRWDVVAHNPWAAALLGDLGPVGGRPRNLMELGFTDPRWRHLVVDWDAEAARHVALYRAAMAAHPDDPAWTSLPERLRATSRPFREIWDRHDVAGPAQRTKRYRTDAGELAFESTTLVVADAPELRLLLLRPLDAATAERLGRLGRLGRRAAE